MRTIVAALALVMMVVGGAHADDKSATADANKKAAAKAKVLRPFVGKLVISPDAPPAVVDDDLPDYIKGNLSPDGAYELIKGAPWPFHVVLVLATATKSVTLVVTDKSDAKAPPLLSATVKTGGDHKLVLANAEATLAAGFEPHKLYVVKVMTGKKQLAKAELLLRD